MVTKRPKKQSAESRRHYKTVMQQLTVANTVGTHKKMREKTLTSLLFVYCVNMATSLPAKSLFEGSGQCTQRGRGQH